MVDIGAEEKDLYEVLTSVIYSCVFNSPFRRVLEDAIMEFVMKVGDSFEARSLLLHTFIAIRGVPKSRRMSDELGMPEVYPFYEAVLLKLGVINVSYVSDDDFSASDRKDRVVFNVSCLVPYSFS